MGAATKEMTCRWTRQQGCDHLFGVVSQVIAAASSAEKLEFCKSAGADHLIDYQATNTHSRRRRRRRSIPPPLAFVIHLLRCLPAVCSALFISRR